MRIDKAIKVRVIGPAIGTAIAVGVVGMFVFKPADAVSVSLVLLAPLLLCISVVVGLIAPYLYWRTADSANSGEGAWEIVGATAESVGGGFLLLTSVFSALKCFAIVLARIQAHANLSDGSFAEPVWTMPVVAGGALCLVAVVMAVVVVGLRLMRLLEKK